MTTDNLLCLDLDKFWYAAERKLEDGRVYYQTQVYDVKADSFPAFFQDWLTRGEPFRVRALAGLKTVSVGVRLKKQPGRGKTYWYAQAKVNGKLRQRYIGLASDMSLFKFEMVVRQFAEMGR
jgi:hypothetical protein